MSDDSFVLLYMNENDAPASLVITPDQIVQGDPENLSGGGTDLVEGEVHVGLLLQRDSVGAEDMMVTTVMVGTVTPTDGSVTRMIREAQAHPHALRAHLSKQFGEGIAKARHIHRPN